MRTRSAASGGFQIVADRAQHHVLFGEQRGKPALHAVVGDNQPADVVRPFRCDLPFGVAGLGKMLDPAGERSQRAGDTPQYQGNRADQQRVDQQRLADQTDHQHALSRRHEGPCDEPATVRQMQPGDDQPFGRGAVFGAEQEAAAGHAALANRIAVGPTLEHHDFADLAFLLGDDRAQPVFGAVIAPFARTDGVLHTELDRQSARSAQLP